jgi:hypothetical protein
VKEKGMVAGLYKKKRHRGFWRGSKIFLSQDVRCKMKEVKEDAYKEKIKRKSESEYKR